MALTYTWNFPTLEVAPSLDGLEQVVTTVHWTLTAQDGSYVASCYGSVGLDAPGTPYTEFAQLTKAQVESWVKAKIDAGRQKVSEIEAGLAGNIETQKQPKTVSMKPPFS
jgi:hypothetical protein